MIPGSRKRRPTRKTVAEPAPAPPPAITAYQKIVAQAMTTIAAALNTIPGYQDDLSTVAPRLRRTVSPEFIDRTATMIESSTDLQALSEITADECRDTTQYSQALRALWGLLNGSTDRVELLARLREVNTGAKVRRVYGVAKNLVKNPNNTHLIPHVETLKAELRRSHGGRSPQRQQPPEQQPPSVPAEKGGVAA